jgi:hypothetical protein
MQSAGLLATSSRGGCIFWTACPAAWSTPKPGIGLWRSKPASHGLSLRSFISGNLPKAGQLHSLKAILGTMRQSTFRKGADHSRRGRPRRKMRWSFARRTLLSGMIGLSRAPSHCSSSTTALATPIGEDHHPMSGRRPISTCPENTSRTAITIQTRSITKPAARHCSSE